MEGGRTERSVEQGWAVPVGVTLPGSTADPRDPFGEPASVARTAGSASKRPRTAEPKFARPQRVRSGPQGRRRRSPGPKPSLHLLASLLAAAVVGCRAPTTDQRTATLGTYGLTTDLPAIEREAGTVYTGHGLRLVRHATTRLTDGKLTLQGTIGFGTSDGSVLLRGSVVAIDRRGYYLTAAHAVRGDPLWVCCGGVFRAAQLVFRGDADFDAAVLAIDRPIRDAFDWADAGRYSAGDTVLQAGPSDSGAPSLMRLLGGRPPMQLFAGRLCGVEDAVGPDGGYQLVTSSLPSRGGDSGGPVMTRAGALIGICVRANPIVARSYAVRPSPAWVREVIEQDYNARPSAPPSTGPDKGPVFPWK